MDIDDVKPISIDSVNDYDLNRELESRKELTFFANEKQVQRLKKNWDSYNHYKLAYASGNTYQGLVLSFIWMVSDIYTTLRYKNLEKVSSLYYRFSHTLTPVLFTELPGRNFKITFMLING